MKCVIKQQDLQYYYLGATIQSPGGEGEAGVFFEINNIGRTLRDINNLLHELFYINM